MTLYDLLNALEINGDLFVSVWDDDNEVYTTDRALWEELNRHEQEALYDLPVTHIYPVSEYRAFGICIELILRED